MKPIIRSDTAGMYNELQKICKHRQDEFCLTEHRSKRVILVSATPLNNRPKTLLTSLSFQDSKESTLKQETYTFQTTD